LAALRTQTARAEAQRVFSNGREAAEKEKADQQALAEKNVNYLANLM